MEAARGERIRAGRRGTETETRRTAPARAGAVLCGWCLGRVRGVCRAAGRPGNLVDVNP